MPRNPVDIHASSRISLIGHSAIVGCHQTADMLLVIALLACVAHAGAQINRVTPLIPQYGTLVGASIDFGAYNNDLSAYEAQLQRSPAAYVVFVAFPFVPAELEATKPILKQIGQRKAIAVITLEPYAGLDAAQSTAALNALAQQVLQWENFGVTVVVRFAHEMNGAWYPWAQRPTAYRYTFALVSEAVKRLTKTATMLWAPNEGGGYPFIGGQYQAICAATDYSVAGSDCSLLDTNKDKQITMDDDPYTPYYPGDTVVDWVGLSVYHFGSTYPWGANNIPEPNKFYDKITGNYNGFGGDQRGVPNFYDMFCNGTYGRNKPMIIGETAALFNLCDVVRTGRGCGDGTSNGDEKAIKHAWWNQVFAVKPTAAGPSIATLLPQIKLINWFDIEKSENEAQGNTVDWTISRNATLRSMFLYALKRRQPGNSRPYWKLPVVQRSAAASAGVADVGRAAAPLNTRFNMNKWTVVSLGPLGSPSASGN